MTTSEQQASAWMQAMRDAAGEVASVALGAEACELVPRVGAMPPRLMGAYLPMFGEIGSFQIGVISEAEGCQGVARMLLGMSADEPELDPSEVRDAVCEIANLVAGGIKRRLAGLHQFEIGLPLFIDGTVIPSDHVEVLACDVELGAIRVTTVLFRDTRASGSRAASSASQAAHSRRG